MMDLSDAASLYFSAAVSGSGPRLWVSRTFLTRGLRGSVASVNLHPDAAEVMM